MDGFLNSLLLVTLSEMGDKTQLLTLFLVLRFRRPWLILAAITLATLANHGLASWLGEWLAQSFESGFTRYVLAGTFFVFGLWMLVPDQFEADMKLKEVDRRKAFITTLIAFFLAEMGDKTQLATVALGARYKDALGVTAGSTLGMLVANGLAVFLGEKLLKKIPMKWLRIVSCISFVAFGLILLIKKET